MYHLFARLAVTGLAVLTLSGTALAQDTFEPDTVLATVNGHEITEEEAALASQDFAEQLQRVPADQRRAVIVDALIDLHLLAGAGEAAGLDESESFQRRMAYQRARTLRTSYLVEVLAAEVDEEALRAAYDEAIEGFEPEEERRARHILVETEDEARALIEELDDGADFATLATERSTGPSASSGGDLGFFGRGRMVPVFEDAAFLLDVGNYTSDPVESQFGWHVIYLEETRQSEAPSFEELAPQIQQGLLQQAFVDAIGGLREEAAISYEVEGLEPPSEAQ